MRKIVSMIFCVFAVIYANDIKVCENDEDIIKGCVEKYYYENGNIKEEILYKNGKADVFAKGYYENGNLEREISIKNGKPDGIVKGYYENGNVKIEIAYENGVKQGVERYYHESGDVKLSLTYKDDEIISGECPNGENLDYTHIQNNKDSFGYYDIDALIKICEQ